MLLMILMVKKLLERFMKKNLQKTNQKEFRIEKVIKRKGNKLYVKSKGYDSSLNSWIDKKDLVWFYWLHYLEMSRCFPKEYKQFGKNINSKVELSNYATKADIKNILHFDTSSFA